MVELNEWFNVCFDEWLTEWFHDCCRSMRWITFDAGIIPTDLLVKSPKNIQFYHHQHFGWLHLPSQFLWNLWNPNVSFLSLFLLVPCRANPADPAAPAQVSRVVLHLLVTSAVAQVAPCAGIAHLTRQPLEMDKWTNSQKKTMGQPFKLCMLYKYVSILCI